MARTPPSTPFTQSFRPDSTPLTLGKGIIPLVHGFIVSVRGSTRVPSAWQIRTIWKSFTNSTTSPLLLVSRIPDAISIPYSIAIFHSLPLHALLRVSLSLSLSLCLFFSLFISLSFRLRWRERRIRLLF